MYVCVVMCMWLCVCAYMCLFACECVYACVRVLSLPPAGALGGNRLPLRHLDLSSNDITAKGAAVLCDVLRGNTHLLSLNLHNNRLPNEAAASMAQLLAFNTTLTYLQCVPPCSRLCACVSAWACACERICYV